MGHRFCNLGALIVFVAAAAACGGDASITTDADCQLEEPGEIFRFVVENTGSETVYLPYGCGDDLPVDVVTGAGRRPLGIIHGNPCGATCEQAYDGIDISSCTTDCGFGVYETLEPGTSVVIEWDRRAYEPHEAPTECTGLSAVAHCALGMRVDDGTIVEAVLEVCPTEPWGGQCTPSDEVVFPIDLSASEAAVEVPF
ncbi:MAG: hypothetical protein DRI90_27020 [Deltaproteobacteria bacterium]|nr:MAG: hypothetical protein DRI90_27020 [Deltaproteobacteria bacterium]